MNEQFKAALGEIGGAFDDIDTGDVQRACDMIADAGNVVLYGCGREGLQMRGFAMRLFHLGRRVAMQGDMTTPPVGRGDLFVVSAGPGELSTVSALMRVARDAGADVLFLTAVQDAVAAKLATHVVIIPAQTMATDQTDDASAILPMGSVYEGALFVLFEVMIANLRIMLDVSDETLRANHTNLE